VRGVEQVWGPNRKQTFPNNAFYAHSYANKLGFRLVQEEKRGEMRRDARGNVASAASRSASVGRKSISTCVWEQKGSFLVSEERKEESR